MPFSTPLPSVSNFLRPEIEALEAATGVRPQVNQLEYHPFVPESTTGLVRWCQAQGIAVTAYGSLGGSSSKAGESGPKDASANLATVAERHGCSSAQVLLRWAVQKKAIVIPGTSNQAHMLENLDIYSFQLSNFEMMSIDDLRDDKEARSFVAMGFEWTEDDGS